jgi:hypothetical protein
MVARILFVTSVLLALSPLPAVAEGLLVTGHVSDDTGRRLPATATRGA